MQQIKHIFFDLDDTLWDYETNSAKVLRELYEEHGLENRSGVRFDIFLPRYRQVNRHMWVKYSNGEISKKQLRDERFANVFAFFGYHEADLFSKLTAQFLERTPREKCLRDGCHEVLEVLSARYNLHIITNGFNDVQSIKIDNGNLRRYFRNIIVSEDHSLNKPDEAIFRLAEKMAGAQAGECAMVGDTFESDVQGAINAKWLPIYYNRNPPVKYEGIVISNLRELLNIF